MDPDIRRQADELRQRVAQDPELSKFDLPALAKPSVRLSSRRVAPAHIGLGESRLGGIPDVPPGFDWPRWLPLSEKYDRRGVPWRPDKRMPLGLIAQLDLSTLPRVDD